MLAYLTWRIVATMPESGLERVAGWMLWVVEAIPILGLTLRTVTLWRLDPRSPPRAGADQAYGRAVVFIPTYNEPAAVLGPTVAAACRLEPDHQTWVLDDGDRPWVRELCETYGARYVQRAVHDHAKAGNINHALALLREEGNPAEFVAILDSDHVPLEGFLHETLGWFDDPSVALVQAPQAYFNEHAFDADGLSGEQGVFFHVLMVSRSGRRADPPWCGSTSIVRRAAIEQVGGIAQETITEDLHTTLKLLRHGWRSVYHHQILAVGLAPDTPEQYLVQRRRWALGAMQVFVRERLWRPKRWLTARNHLEYLMSAFWWFEGAATVALMTLPAAVLVMGVEPVRVSPLLYAGAVGVEVACRLIGAHLLFRGYIRWRHALELRILRIPVGLESLWWLLTRRKLAFQVTPKDATEERQESSAPRVVVGLALVLGVVLAYGALTLFVDLPWRSSTEATLTGGVWLLWGEVMLLLGLARIRSPEFRTTRRAAHRFTVAATVDVDGVRGRLQDISTTGIAAVFETAPPVGEAKVQLPGGRPIRMQSVRIAESRSSDPVTARPVHRGAYAVLPDDYAAIQAQTDWIFFTPRSLDHGVPDGLPAAAVMSESRPERATPPPPPPRRNDIQGLRALAVGLVVASHLGVASMTGGFVGVDVFFVISGFLITGLMLREQQLEGRISLRDFYTRRAQRILPAAILVSAAILFVTGLTQSSVRVRQYLHDALWSAGFLQNEHLIDQATDYFADTAASPFQHFWSLSVEEQFYVVWPLMLLLLIRALSPVAILAIVGTAVALSLAASVSLTVSRPEEAYFSTYTRAFELGLGALLALAVAPGVRRSTVRMPQRLATIFAWLGGGLGVGLIAASALMMSSDGFPGWHALIPTLGTVALIAAGRHRQVGLNRLLGIAPLRWLGDISYSLYLWHFPVIVLGRPLLPSGWPGAVQSVVLVAVSLGAADLTYRGVERPLLRRRRTTFRGVRPLVWWPVAFATALAVAFGATAYAEHRQAESERDAAAWFAGHADACPQDALTPADSPSLAQVRAELECAHTLADLAAPVPPGVTADALAGDGFAGGRFCWDHARTDSIIACADDVDPARGDLVLLGDSHMGQWLPAFQRIAAERGLDFVPFVKPGCPIWDLETRPGGKNGNDPACAAYRAQALRQIAALDPAVVVVGSIVDARAGDAGDPVGDGWRAAIGRTLVMLPGLGSRVAVLADTPLRGESVPNCLGTPGNGVAGCELTRPGDNVLADAWLRTQVDAAGLAWVDPTPLVCAERSCPAVAGGIGMYSDESHVSRTWSAHVWSALAELLEEAGPLTGAAR